MKQGEMQNLVDSIAKDRQKHLERLEQLKMHDLKELVNITSK
jgi:hypothetical protein